MVWFEIFMLAAEIPFLFLLKVKKAKTIIIVSMLTYILPVLFGFFMAWLVTLYMAR